MDRVVWGVWEGKEGRKAKGRRSSGESVIKKLDVLLHKYCCEASLDGYAEPLNPVPSQQSYNQLASVPRPPTCSFQKSHLDPSTSQTPT